MTSSSTSSTILNQCRVAILATDGFEQAELESPRDALRQAGAQVDVVSNKTGSIQGFEHTSPGRQVAVDQTLAQCSSDNYDALVLPGGVVNGDALRIDEQAQAFVVKMAQAGKPVGVICHGGWILISCDLVQGHTLTSWPSLKDDVQNAGGHWVDQEVVVDGMLVSSRKPGDLPMFNQALINLFGKTTQTMMDRSKVQTPTTVYTA